jgi:hypothetical protein
MELQFHKNRGKLGIRDLGSPLVQDCISFRLHYKQSAGLHFITPALQAKCRTAFHSACTTSKVQDCISFRLHYKQSAGLHFISPALQAKCRTAFYSAFTACNEGEERKRTSSFFERSPSLRLLKDLNLGPTD